MKGAENMTVESKPFILGTTVLAVRARGKAAMAGDGQVTLETNHTILKSGARKVRKLYKNSVIAGFAGSVGDALTLFDKLEGHLEETRGDLPRATVNLAKEWRTDRVLRQLKAMLLCMDKQHLLVSAQVRSSTRRTVRPRFRRRMHGSRQGSMRFTDMDG